MTAAKYSVQGRLAHEHATSRRCFANKRLSHTVAGLSGATNSFYSEVISNLEQLELVVSLVFAKISQKVCKSCEARTAGLETCRC
jgi:hypothetical protein